MTFFLPAFRQFESQFHHAVDFVIVIFKRIHGALAAILDVASFRPAEVQAARQFAHDENIHTFEFLRLERRRSNQRRMHFDRAQIRKNAQTFAQGEQSAFGAIFGGGVIPFRSADRTEQNRIADLQSARVSSVSDEPYLSIEQPPIKRSVNSNE